MSEIVYPKFIPSTIPVVCGADDDNAGMSNVTKYWILFTITMILIIWTLFMLSYISNIKMIYSGMHPSIIR